MDNKERQIKELNDKIGISEAAVKNLQKELGEAALADSSDKNADSLASHLIKEITEIDRKVDSEHKRIQDILNAVERTDEIEALRKSLNDRIRSIEKDNISNYETIGRAGYEAFKSGELPAEKYAELFDEVIKMKLQTEELELEKAHLEDGGKEQGFFGRMKAGAKVLYLKNSISGNYRLLQKYYKKSGERLCHSELVMNLEAESVRSAMQPVRENLAGIEKLEKESSALSSENEKLLGNLEGLGAGTNAVRTVAQIEKDVNDLYRERNAKLDEAGGILYLNQKDSAAKSKKARDIIKEIDKQNRSIEDCQNEIKRLEAELEIERQNREIESLNKKIAGYEEKIQNYSQEAEQLKDKIDSAAREIKKLEESTKAGDGEDE